MLISLSCSPVESPRDSREPRACWPLVGRAGPGMLAAGTCRSQVFWLQGRGGTPGHRSSLHPLLIVIDVFRCIIRQIASLISQVVFSLYCVPWCSEVLAFDRVHVAYFYFCCLCLCFHIQEVLTKCNVIKMPCCVFFSRTLTVLCLTCRSLMDQTFWLIFAYGVYLYNRILCKMKTEPQTLSRIGIILTNVMKEDRPKGGHSV